MRPVRVTAVPWHLIVGRSDLSLAIALFAFLAVAMARGPWQKGDAQGIPVSLKSGSQAATFQQNLLHLRLRPDHHVDIRGGQSPNQSTIELDHLRTHVAIELSNNPNVGASITVDPAVRYADVIEALDQLLRLRIPKIILNGPPPMHPWWIHTEIRPGITWVDIPPIRIVR
jgi:biopolymer transport protein ExbD